MASIEKYSTKDGVRYRARFRDPGGRQRKGPGFKTKRDVNLWIANNEVKKATGQYADRALGRITVGELAVDWLARKQQLLAATTMDRYGITWRLHVAPTWAAIPVATIDVLGIETWITKLQHDGAGASVVRLAYGILLGILNDAMKANRITSNPAKGVENLPKPSAKHHVYLTEHDVAKLATEAGRLVRGGRGGPQQRALVLALAYTGIRWGEASALRVRDIEFLRKRLSISKSVSHVRGRMIEGTPKTDKARSVPVPPFVLEELAALCVGKGLDDLVFPRWDGGYMTVQNPNRGWFANAVRAAGIQRVTPHDLRHTCASLAISAGVNVLVVSRMLGHAKPSITLDVYADLLPSDLEAVAETMDARYGPAHTDVPKMFPRPVSDGS